MLATTAAELLTLLRSELDDSLPSSGADTTALWKTATLLAYLNEGCDAVAKRTHGLFKTLAVKAAAGKALASLPPHVLHIRNVHLLSNGKPLQELNANEAAQAFGYSAHTGEPAFYTRDYDARGLVLRPTPQVDDRIEVQCSVTLEEPLTLGDELPFLDAEDQRILLHFLKMRAYGQQDAETYDPQRYQRYESLYRDAVEARASELRSYRRKPGLVRMEW